MSACIERLSGAFLVDAVRITQIFYYSLIVTVVFEYIEAQSCQKAEKCCYTMTHGDPAVVLEVKEGCSNFTTLFCSKLTIDLNRMKKLEIQIENPSK